MMKMTHYRKGVMFLVSLMLVLGSLPAIVASEPIKIVTAHSSSKDFGDLTEILAWEAIKSKGYDVVFKSTATPALAAQALINNDAQFAAISSVTGMRAVQAGARIKMVSEHKANEWSLVTLSSITAPKQLV